MSGQADRPVRIMLVEDEQAFMEALALALSLTPDLEVVAKTRDASEVVELSRASKPDMVVTDFRLAGDSSGADVLSLLRGDGCRARLVVLTSYPAPVVVRAAEEHAASVITKDQGIADLVSALRAVVTSTSLLIPDDAESPLSSGELQVLEAINEGMNVGEIATTHSLSVHTVRARLKSTFKKLDVGSQVEAVAEATRRGLLVPPS